MLNNISKLCQIKMYRNIPFRKLFHQKMKILVIGAGIAGLAAAAALYEKGYTNVCVLEAQENIGGRILSLPLNNNFLELGAQWIHGTDNPLYEFSLNNHLLCDSSAEPSYEGSGLFCTSNGDVIDMTVVEEVKAFLESTKHNLNDGQFNDCSASISVQTLFCKSFDAYVDSYTNDPLNILRKGLFKWFLKFEIIDNACDNLDQVAVQSYSDWCNISEEVYHINFTKGFRSLVNTLHSQIPPGSLKLKKPVRTINWKKKFAFSDYTKALLRTRSSNAYPVLVECEDGDNIVADSVILTASTGYLKENMKSLFNPALPDKKAKAFINIGFGTINKIYLIYKIPFWKAEDVGFQLVWTTNMDEELSNLLKNHPWINGITGFDIVSKQPNVLLGWIGGTEAKMIESVDIEIVSSVCTKLLRKFLNSPDIPYPSETLRTCWYSNKYIKGSYSYRSCNFYLSQLKLEDLQSPLYSNCETKNGKVFQLPVVYFAGEAMDENCFSSVHGAFQSGLKVVDDINLTCSQIEDTIGECCDE